MNDYTKHNAKIAQEFAEKVLNGADPWNLWQKINFEHIDPDARIPSIFNFYNTGYKYTWKPKIIDKEETTMENQHQKIKGYRELNQKEIDLMNEVKQKGIELELLVKKLGSYTDTDLPSDSENFRWVSIGKTHLQQGLMALTRSIAKPDSF